MKKIRTQILRSLDKLLPGMQPPKISLSGLSGLRGERISFQIAFCAEGEQHKVSIPLHVETTLPTTLFLVGNVPCEMPAYPNTHDANYLTVCPGLFPDPLLPLDDHVEAICGLWRTLWVEVSIPLDAPAGMHRISVRLGDTVVPFSISVLDCSLPPQNIRFTQWIHYDCMAQVHHVPIFSEQHWDWMRAYIRLAVMHGVDTLLTPLFTPPLDTAVGAERPTVQLVRVSSTPDGQYSFDFSLLARFFAMARQEGIRFFEMSHLFTQWGAAHAPKILVDDVVRFGWHTDADSDEYVAFLHAFLPKLCDFLRAEGLLGQVFFHVSDEPNAQQLPAYRHAREILRKGAPQALVLDAISDFTFYQQGLIDRPVVGLDHMKPFLEHSVPHLWGYVCCAQNLRVPNRFLAQTSACNRAVALPLFRFQIEGVLHWGFNFYYSQYSRALIDPFRTTDAQFAFPGGDAFSVYPGADAPIPSLRLKVFYEALCDLRAFSCLPRAWVMARIGNCDFEHYPNKPGEILALRERINQEISKQNAPHSSPF